MATLQYGALIQQTTTTVTSGGTTTLINTSATIQVFTGTSNQTVLLPVATTFTKSGASFQLYNFSTGSIQVNYQDSSAFQTIPANSTLIVNCYNNSTANGQWTSLTNSTVPSVNAPTVQRFLSGSGTYTTPTSPSPLYLKVRVLGGGGGGAGSGTGSSGGNGGNGGTSSFGTLVSVPGGTGGTPCTTDSPGLGGSIPTINSPAIEIISVAGSDSVNILDTTAADTPGGYGGSSYVGGGANSIYGAGNDARTNSGSGGSGGGTSSTPAEPGTGGGSGSYAEVFINAPSTTYSYSVGTAGDGGSAGTSGFTGGAGGVGIIIVEEYYN